MPTLQTPAMLDLALTKLALIGAVALIVIGPEKLPKVARMAGSLIGRAQRYLNHVKSEVSREIELDELRKMQQEVTDVTTDLKSSINREITEVDQEVQSIQSSWTPPHKTSSAFTDQSSINHKAREFRRKKLSRNSALPTWYKNQQGHKTHILSAAARVARYRPKPR